MIETQFKTENGVQPVENVADAMVMNDTLRYATLRGESKTIEDGEIVKARSEQPLKVIISLSATGDTVERTNCVFVNKSDNMVYLGFPNMRAESYVGTIKRLTRQVLPQ